MTNQAIYTKYELFGGVNNTGKLARSLAAQSMKHFASFIKNRRESKPGAIIAYAAPTFGSLGDQAMFLVAMRNLRSAGYKTISLVAEEKPARLDLPQRADWLLQSKHYFGGTIAESTQFQKELFTSNGFFVIGADMLDGHYSATDSLRKIHLLQLASSFGITSRAFGFSFNERPDETVVAALRALPETVELLARDPVSHRRLESTLDRPIRLVADLAFLIQPDPTGESAIKTLNWIKQQRTQGAQIIGINANAQLARGNFDHPFTIAAGLARTIIELHQAHSDLRFVLIPHDFRGSFNDGVLNRITYEIASFDNKSLKERMFLMPSPCFASEVKAVSAELDFAITGRMHFAIACLGQGTPAICIGYQGKMEGLFEHFDLPNMVISPSDAFTKNELGDMAKATLAKAAELRAQINKCLPKVHSLAELNFA